MPDISQIKTPDGTVYDIKDTVARNGSFVAKSGDSMTGRLVMIGSASSQPLQTRGIVGGSVDGSTLDALHLQYGNAINDSVAFGNTAGGQIYSNGTKFSGSSDLNVLKAGDTMTGQLKTSFKESVAMGSYGATSGTIPNLINELRYSSGCCGSFALSTAYTLSGYTIGTGWYNFFYIPHRSGGKNGAADSDNCNYGTLILFGMTVNGAWRIRYSSSGIQTLNPFGIGDGIYKSIWNSGIGIGIATNPNDSTSIGIGVSNAATFRSSIGLKGCATQSISYHTVSCNIPSNSLYKDYSVTYSSRTVDAVIPCIWTGTTSQANVCIPVITNVTATSTTVRVWKQVGASTNNPEPSLKVLIVYH